MAKIELSQRSVATRFSPQPFSTGSGYEAPGRALQGLGGAVSSFGAAIAEQQEKDELFQFNADLQRFRNDQELKFQTYGDTYQGSGHDFAPSVLQGYDSDWQKFRDERVPERLKGRADFYGERFRGSFMQRGYKVGQQKRGEWYVQQGTSLFSRSILPRVTGDVRSAEAGLTAAEGLIASMDGIPPEVAENLRTQAANAIFKRWLSEAGVEAGAQARALVDRVNASRQGATPGSFRGAQDAGTAADPTMAGPLTIHTSRVPTANERRAIFRKGGVVINLDTNWSAKGATEPMVVVPDGATAEQRQAAQAYANQIAVVYREQFGRNVSPRVVTRSENGRGRAATIHTEPFAVTDPEAVAFFSSDAGLARHAQIVRDTLGRIPGAEFSIPHNPGQGDRGAHGTGTNEVALAQALIGKLTGGDGSVVPTRPYQVASNAAVPPPGPVRALTTMERFEQLVIENADKIERNELKALRKAEEMAAEKEKKIQEATRLEGYKLLFDRKLTPEWVDANEQNLSSSAFITLRKAVTPMGRTTNPEVLSKLLDDAKDLPTDTIEEANAAYARGDLTHDDYRVIVSSARRALNPETNAPPWVKAQKDTLRQQLRPKGQSSAEAWGHYGNVVKQFNAYVDKMGDDIDRDKLATFTTRLIEDAKRQSVDTTRMSLEMPRFASGVSRATMTPEAIDAAVAATIQARQAGTIDEATFVAEAKRLKAWSEFLAQEAEMFGTLQKQGAGKFSAPIAPRSQVRSMTQDAPGEVSAMPLPPEVLDAVQQALAQIPNLMQAPQE